MSLCISPVIARTRHPNFAGMHQLSADTYVTRNEVGGQYRVYLYSKRSCKVLGTVVTQTDGAYEFTHLVNDADDFFVVAFDQPGGGLTMGCSDSLTLTQMTFVF